MPAGEASWKFEARSISHAFWSPDGRAMPVLDGIDLSVRPNEFFAIVGPSGCGKSTFLRILANLATPSAGQVIVDGRPVTRPGRNRATVFQHDLLYPWLTVTDNIAFGLDLGHVPARERAATVERLVRLVGLTGLEARYPNQLSGGQRQRANLARALAIDPAILLMDEPFAALDAQTRESMQAELLRIWLTNQKTVIFVTHQIEEAVFLADRVAVFTHRPARIREILTIALPRPRALEVKLTAEFLAYVKHIWERLRPESEAAAEVNIR